MKRATAATSASDRPLASGRMTEASNAASSPETAPPGRSLYIACPMYGALEPAFFVSCLALTHALMQAGVPHSFAPLCGESHITRGRNKLAHQFVAHRKETHFLFLDCDLAFEPATILRMLRADLDVVGAPYPLKALPPRLVCTVNPAERTAMKDGFVRAHDVPTGCMMVARRVFERLREIVHTCRDDVDPDEAKREIYSLYFDDGCEDGTRADSRWLSEDYWFTRMCQLAGCETWLDARARLKHVGKLAFEAPSLEEIWAAEDAERRKDAADAIELPDPILPPEAT